MHRDDAGIDIQSHIQDRLEKLKGQLLEESFRQNLMTKKLNKKTKQFHNLETLPRTKKILIKSIQYEQHRVQTATTTTLPAIKTSPIKKKTPLWSNKYCVAHSDWEDDIRVLIQSVPATDEQQPIDKSEKAIVQIQKWFRRYRQIHRWKSAASSVMILHRLEPDVHKKRQNHLTSAEQVLSRINREVDRDIQRRKEYEAAILIQERYKKFTFKHMSPAGRAARILNRTNARKAYALELLEKEKAAIRIQAILRGRNARKRVRVTSVLDIVY